MLDPSQCICNFARKMLIRSQLPGSNAVRAGRSMWGRASTAVTMFLLLGLIASGAAAGIGGSAFSEEEWRRLEAGELVARKQTTRRNGLELMGGSSWQVIDAAPDVVFSALLDTNRYPRMMPQVIEAKLVASKDTERTVFVRQGQKGVAEKRYYLRVNVNEEKRDITFAVDDKRPHDLRAAWGFYTVRPFKDGKTLLAYGVMVDLGGGILSNVFEDEIHEWMLKTPWTVKRFVESGGGNLYAKR
jgi:ribosome-associated toxin RatA of RatAB toxin-antitoxin module